MEFKYFIENGGVTITGRYSGYRNKLIIPEFINGYPVTTINSGSFIGLRKLKTIIIPTTVKNIDKHAFGDLCGVKINNIGISSYHIINNKFIVGFRNFLTISNQINNDYVVKWGKDNYYIIGEQLYNNDFRISMKMEINYGI